jgi:ribosomal protein S6
MRKIKTTNNYESVIVTPSKYIGKELKDLLFSQAQELKNLGASNISFVSRGRRKFAYPLKEHRAGNYIEIFFNSSPKLISIYENTLKLNKNLIRYLVTKLEIN